MVIPHLNNGVDCYQLRDELSSSHIHLSSHLNESFPAIPKEVDIKHDRWSDSSMHDDLSKPVLRRISITPQYPRGTQTDSS